MHDRCAKSKALPQLVEGLLEGDEQAHLEAHLEECDVCQQALDTLVDDETAGRIAKYLRRSRPVSDTVLLGVMDRVRTTTFGTETLEPLQIDDFAVEYLHPADNPDMLGRLGPYEVSEVIGSGGMGIVLKGNDSKLNRVVAIKVLTPFFALNSTARKRFIREAQAAAAVGHPNVVTIHTVDEDRLPYLVMEFVDGPTLQDRLDSEGFLKLNQILRIGVQVAAGLEAAHAQGLVHRDIKPSNILLEKGIERVKLSDFGLARAADDASVTREGTVVGTPQYMSPEQARGEPVDQSSDLFSLGSVLYTLATGRPPFRAETSYGVMRRISDEEPTPICELNPEIPEWLNAIIRKLMAKQKQSRFLAVTEVHELLGACLSHVQQPTVSNLPEIPGLQRKQRVFPIWKVLLGVVVMFLVATGLLFALSSPATPQPEQQVEHIAEQDSKPQSYVKEFTVDFPNPNEIGTLNVDIKRGAIRVSGYDGDKVIVKLTVPNYSPETSQESGGLRELRPNTLDFEIERSKEQIKVDGNSNEYTMDLDIRVPRETNLILDSYWDGVIEVEGVVGRFNLRSQNNDIRLEGVSGSARLWSYNGNLVADFEAVTRDQPLYFESYNGSIDLALPTGTKANTRYRSGTGKVLTDFEIALSEDSVQIGRDSSVGFDEFVQGTLNGGGPTLTLETEKGDIRLRRRMNGNVR